jgi:sugar-specific transcriptional regulator TrmB
MEEPLPHEEILQDIGLTKNESRVYLSLLKKKTATAVEIAEESKVHRVNVYDAIKKLKLHGLVTEMQLENKKVFVVSQPKNIMNILKEKELKLSNILPELELQHSINKKTCDIQMFESQNAIRKQFLRFVERSEPIYYWGLPKIILSLIGKDFQEEIHKRRAAKQQWMYHIYNSDADERSRYLNTLPFTKSRCSQPAMDSPVATAVCGEELVLNLVTQEKVITVSIINKALAQAYEKYFWVLWENSKEM